MRHNLLNLRCVLDSSIGMACAIIIWYIIKRKSYVWTRCGFVSWKTVWRFQHGSNCQLSFCDFHQCFHASVGVCGQSSSIFHRWDILQLFCYSEVLVGLYSGFSHRVLTRHEHSWKCVSQLLDKFNVLDAACEQITGVSSLTHKLTVL